MELDYNRGTPRIFKLYLKKDTPPRFSDTNLEKAIDNILKSLGYREGVDYFRQYSISGYYLDFAFPSIKLAIEPGATYWHTPKWVKGEPLRPVGYAPEDVYYPPLEKDIKKNEVLNNQGWVILWMNENILSATMRGRIKGIIKRVIESRQEELEEFSESQ